MEILKKPLITEKATSESELKNRFTFLVKVDANKVEIKKQLKKNMVYPLKKFGLKFMDLKGELDIPKMEYREGSQILKRKQLFNSLMVIR